MWSSRSHTSRSSVRALGASMLAVLVCLLAACAEGATGGPAGHQAPVGGFGGVGAGGTGGALPTGGTGGAGGDVAVGGMGGSAGSGGAAGVRGWLGGDGGTEVLLDAGGGEIEGPWSAGIPIDPYAQKPGDPAAGYAYLTNAGYFGCGVPKRFFGLVQPFATLPGISNEPLPGRTATVDGAPLGYNWNLAKNKDGVDVVYMNCLQCHAGKFNGKLIVGLGNVDADWTVNLGNAAGASGLLGLLGPTPQEQAELNKFIGRLNVIGTPAVMRVVGTNPAEMLAVTFVSHRDRNTLAWSDTALLRVPAIDDMKPGETIVSDVPPWWRMSKKHAQFYNGMGRGDHRRSMMLAGSLCTDSVAEAEAIDAHFNDVAAYISSIEPPAWPWAIDAALAEQGHDIFLETCAGCHGTYAPDFESYPNLLIPRTEVKTDFAVSSAGTTDYYGSNMADWYNNSWYGQIGPYEPFDGYVAPPLDAIWATAPYLHNGSVPDMETLLDSTKRPAYWRRVDHDTTNYDQDSLGFPWLPLTAGQNAPPFGVAANQIYDTTLLTHSNSGHNYGDALTPAERRAVIEYLKTL